MTDAEIGRRRDAQSPAIPRGLAKPIEDGTCVLFLGSALHAPPPEGSEYVYPAEQRPPIGSQLSRRIADEFDFEANMPNESKEDLMRVAMYVETGETFGRTDLLDYLDTQLRGPAAAPRRPSAAVRMLAELPFRIIVTTNYDLLLDEALTDLAAAHPRQANVTELRLFGGLEVMPAEPTLIALAISCGWALSMTFSPFATVILLMARVGGLRPLVLTWGWNLAFTALAAASLVPLFALLLRLV